MAQLLAPRLNVAEVRRALRRTFAITSSHPQRLRVLHVIFDFEDDIARMQLPKKRRE